MSKTMQLPCALTVEERAQRADQHLRVLDEMDDLEYEKATWKRRAEEARSRETTLREILRSGQEPRAVEVLDELRSGIVVTYRVDTGEVVSTRAATDQDRQLSLVPETHDEIDQPEALLEHIPEPEEPKAKRRRVTVVHVPENARR